MFQTFNILLFQEFSDVILRRWNTTADGYMADVHEAEKEWDIGIF